MYNKIISSKTKIILHLPFLLECILFIFLAWLLWLGFPVLLNRSGENGHLSFVLCLKGKAFSLMLLSIILAVGLLYIVFAVVGYVSSVLNLCRAFLKIIYFVKSCFCTDWEVHLIFIFPSVNVVYHIYWFAYVEPVLHPQNKPPWWWWMLLLICCWIWFANILLRIFTSILIRDIGV